MTQRSLDDLMVGRCGRVVSQVGVRIHGLLVRFVGWSGGYPWVDFLETPPEGYPSRYVWAPEDIAWEATP